MVGLFLLGVSSGLVIGTLLGFILAQKPKPVRRKRKAK